MFTRNTFEGWRTFCGLKVLLKLNLSRLSLELPVMFVELYKQEVRQGDVDKCNSARR